MNTADLRPLDATERVLVQHVKNVAAALQEALTEEDFLQSVEESEESTDWYRRTSCLAPNSLIEVAQRVEDELDLDKELQGAILTFLAERTRQKMQLRAEDAARTNEEELLRDIANEEIVAARKKRKKLNRKKKREKVAPEQQTQTAKFEHRNSSEYCNAMECPSDMF